MRNSKRAITLLVFILLLSLFIDMPVFADKGSISPWPVSLSQDSQRAIIMHNLEEEVLILGTELRADKETYVLEFIPFPSQPDVRLSAGDPFKEIERLMVEEKGIELIEAGLLKGGGPQTAPVEIRLGEKIGVHDVTVIKINDISGFVGWVDRFFKEKKVDVSNNLENFYKNAEDYVKRGINYFVFDYVPVKTETRFIEPLIYRFKTDKIYYPLKTSNTIGGEGTIDLIFICPGSFPEKDYFSPDSDIRTYFQLSNSDRIYTDEIERVYPEATNFFSKVEKLFIQMMRYKGIYNFRTDFIYDPHKLDPRPYIWEGEYFLGYGLTPVEEDYKRRIFYSYPYLTNFEYEVYRTVFTSRELEGIFPKKINLANATLKRELHMDLAKRFGRAIIEDFNIKNEREYELNDLWIPKVKGKFSSSLPVITLIDKNKTDLASETVFYVSRVGFNMNKTKALVYLEKVTEGIPNGYTILLTRESPQDKWKITEIIYTSHLLR